MEQILEDTPGIRLAESGDVRQLTGKVCDVASRAMARASYQGQHQDISMLAGDLQEVLLSGGVRPVGADWASLENAAERLASFAQGNLRQFRSRARGE